MTGYKTPAQRLEAAHTRLDKLTDEVATLQGGPNSEARLEDLPLGHALGPHHRAASPPTISRRWRRKPHRRFAAYSIGR